MKKIALVFALFASSLVCSARSESVTWIGVTNNWETPENWTPNGIPWAADDVHVDAALFQLAPTLHSGAIVDMAYLVLAGQSFTISDPAGFGILDVRKGIRNTGELKIIEPEVALEEGTIEGSLAFGTLNLTINTSVIIAPEETTSVRLLNLSAESPLALARIDGQLSGLADTRIRLFVDPRAGTGYYTLGTSFDFTTGDFRRATLDYVTGLPQQYAWDLSRFQSEGVITLVPEPSSVILLTCGAIIGCLARRRASSRK